MPAPSTSMPTCRMCRSGPADSRGHLIPSALGGRRRVGGVLCTRCNNECGESIDAECAEALRAIRMMLGITGDRGQEARVSATDESGRRIILGQGLSVEHAPGPPEILETGEDFERVRFGSVRERDKYIAAQR